MKNGKDSYFFRKCAGFRQILDLGEPLSIIASVLAGAMLNSLRCKLWLNDVLVSEPYLMLSDLLLFVISI